jgi:hypothetical protein
MNKLVFAVAVLALCSLNFIESLKAGDAQRGVAAVMTQKSATQTMSYPFTASECSFVIASGTKNAFPEYCVTANGNITVLETPQSFEHTADVGHLATSILRSGQFQ